MAAIKPLKIYGGVLGPNPSKVMILLCALKIPYEVIPVAFKDVKGPEYVKINPNGRLPTLEDPNTGFRIWESGAIFEYVIDKYDTEFKLSFKPGTDEYYLCKQWLHFQMSGQGPYYGQAVWFLNYNQWGEPKVPSAIDRYVNEIKRVSAVLNKHLSTHKWLVGDKATYADFAFLPWQEIAINKITPLFFDAAKEFPHVQRWVDEMIAFPGVAKIFEEKRIQQRAIFGEKADKPMGSS